MASVPERVYPTVFSEADAVHRARYHLALGYIRPGDRVLDAACGVGYGAHYLAQNSRCDLVVAVDRSEEALAWGRQHFSSPRVHYVQADLVQEFVTLLPAQSFDVITSFETLEHLEQDLPFLEQLAALLRPGGILLLSTPNEEMVPWRHANNPYHYRHYRQAELQDLLHRCGFAVEDWYSQTCDTPLFRGAGGDVHIAVCRKGKATRTSFTDLHQIAALCYVVASRPGPVTRWLPLAALGQRFAQLVSAYARYGEALDRLVQQEWDKAIATAEGINGILCPEREFVLGAALEGKGQAQAAALHYRHLLASRTLVTPALAGQAEGRLRALVAATHESGPAGEESEWELRLPGPFLDPQAEKRFCGALACSSASALLAPVVYDVFSGHRMARWEVVARRRAASSATAERVLAYVQGANPAFPYADAYREFTAGRYMEALASFQRHFAGATTLEEQAVYVRWVALCLLELGRDREAIHLLEGAVDLCPTYTDLWYLLFLALALAGDTDRLELVYHAILTAGDATAYPEFFVDIRHLTLARLSP